MMKVVPGSPADGEVRRGDVLTKINSLPCAKMTHQEASDMIKNAGPTITITLHRYNKLHLLLSKTKKKSLNMLWQNWIEMKSVPRLDQSLQHLCVLPTLLQRLLNERYTRRLLSSLLCLHHYCNLFKSHLIIDNNNSLCRFRVLIRASVRALTQS